jgi:hypothetical protein
MSVDDVKKILSNPVYAGLEPYPSIVPDETWIEANAHRVREEGPAEAVRSILDAFQETLPFLQPLEQDTYVKEAEDHPQVALQRLLGDLRDLVEGAM